MTTIPLKNHTMDIGDDKALEACQGIPEALGFLRQQYHSKLINILLARGANVFEACEIMDDLWADCVPGANNKPSLLIKYSRKFSLLSWLARVSCNRWIDLKRRGKKQIDMQDADFDQLPGCSSELIDDNLLKILAESLGVAFDQSSEEALIMLRLVHMHGLTQREVGKLFGSGEAKISRTLSKAMEDIKTRTLTELKRRDPNLELTWEDFLGLCVTGRVDFL
jgi:RNA polymerase sigma factor (sigma-70 family)